MIKQRFSLLLAVIIVAAIAMAALLVLLSQIGGGRVLSGNAEAQEFLAGVPQEGTTLGRQDAPVTIQLYEDFQCPVCARFLRERFPELVTRYVEPGEVKVVSETLAFLGPDSVSTARAALAAGEQDLYWQYAALLFLNQGRENSGYATDEFLTELAEETQGLDVERWDEARTSGSSEPELEAVRDRAQADGVEGTPTLVITGPEGTRKLTGAVPADELAATIDEVRAS